MRLTKKKALDISIELWERMAKGGAKWKYTWSGWREYGEMLHDCPLCEFVGVNGIEKGCKICPLQWGKFGCEDNVSSSFREWCRVDDKPARKKYAGLFLEQLKEIRDGVSSKT